MLFFRKYESDLNFLCQVYQEIMGSNLHGIRVLFFLKSSYVILCDIVLQIGDRKFRTRTMASTVLPDRFDGDDFDHWPSPFRPLCHCQWVA